MDEAWLARRQIFSLAADRAVLGACAGLALFGMWLVVRMALRLRRLESGRGTVVQPAPRVRPGYAGRMRRPDDWTDGELIAALARRSGRVGVLLVSPAEVERLAADGGNVTGPPATPRDALPPSRTPGLPSPESAEPAGGTAVPAKPAPPILEAARTRQSRTSRPTARRLRAGASRASSSSDGRLDRRRRRTVPGRELL